MSAHFHACLWLTALLISCDKPQDSGKSAAANKSNPSVTHANRPPRANSPNTRQKLREALEAAIRIEAPEARDQALAEVARNALKFAPEISAEAIQQLSADSPEKVRLLRYCAKFSPIRIQTRRSPGRRRLAPRRTLMRSRLGSRWRLWIPIQSAPSNSFRRPTSPRVDGMATQGKSSGNGPPRHRLMLRPGCLNSLPANPATPDSNPSCPSG